MYECKLCPNSHRQCMRAWDGCKQLRLDKRLGMRERSKSIQSARGVRVLVGGRRYSSPTMVLVKSPYS